MFFFSLSPHAPPLLVSTAKIPVASLNVYTDFMMLGEFSGLMSAKP